MQQNRIMSTETARPRVTTSKRKLIILSGLPRSGTTWVGKIFDSHPLTLYRHEPDSWYRLNAVPLGPDVVAADEYRDMIGDFIGGIESMMATKVAGSLPAFPKHYYTPWIFQFRKLWIAGAKVLGTALGELPIPPFVDYAHYPEIVLVWKSIESTARLGVIATLFPETRIIHLVRHPCGYVASILRGEAARKFTEVAPSNEDLGIFDTFLDTPQARSHDLNLDALAAMHPTERLAWRWVLFNEKAMDDLHGLGNAMTIRYEDLCQNPMSRTKEAFEFSGLSWNDQTERFLTKSTSANNDSYYSIQKNPQEASTRWQTQLSPRDIELVEGVVKETTPGRLYY